MSQEPRLGFSERGGAGHCNTKRCGFTPDPHLELTNFVTFFASFPLQSFLKVVGVDGHEIWPASILKA